MADWDLRVVPEEKWWEKADTWDWRVVTEKWWEMAEEWRAIPGCPGYEISDKGRVRSYHKQTGDGWRIANKPQRLLRQSVGTHGYLFVHPTPGPGSGKKRNRYVATLVMEMFIGPCPEDKEVCHCDGDPFNNNVDNLRYDTHAGNLGDRTEETMLACGVQKVTGKQVIEIRQRYAGDDSLSQKILAHEYGVSEMAISQICTGRTFRDLPGPITKGRYNSGGNRKGQKKPRQTTT